VNIQGGDAPLTVTVGGFGVGLGYGGSSFMGMMTSSPANNAVTGKNFGAGASGPACQPSTSQKAGAVGGPGVVIVVSYL